MKKYRLFILLFILFTISSCQSNKKQILKMNIDGIVSDKFIDKDNHNAKFIRIHQFDNTGQLIGSEEFLLIDSYDFTGVWDSAQIGDTVRKEVGASDLIIIKPGNERITLKYDD